jgi:hypothetical protein
MRYTATQINQFKYPSTILPIDLHKTDHLMEQYRHISPYIDVASLNPLQ